MINFFTPKQEKRWLSYDFSSIKPGESIVSEISDTHYLCIRMDEALWRVYRYESGRVDNLGEHEDPSLYIYPEHRIYDTEESVHVAQRWIDAMKAYSTLTAFMEDEKRRFVRCI